jgi:hypothetical protein
MPAIAPDAKFFHAPSFNVERRRIAHSERGESVVMSGPSKIVTVVRQNGVCLTCRNGQNARRFRRFALTSQIMSQISTSTSRFATCRTLMIHAIVDENH